MDRWRLKNKQTRRTRQQIKKAVICWGGSGSVMVRIEHKVDSTAKCNHNMSADSDQRDQCHSQQVAAAR